MSTMIERMLDMCDWQDPQLHLQHATWFWLTERHV